MGSRIPAATRFLALCGTVLLLGAAVTRAPTVPPGANAAQVEGRYIVVMRENSRVAAASDRVSSAFALDPLVTYSESINGFVATVPEAMVPTLRADPDVLSVEPDSFVRAAIHENLFQTLPTGIDRVDAESLGGSGIGGPPGPDANADVAVIDSGIDIGHPDLNVAGGTRFTGPACSGGSYDDDYFHGTHVAGTIAARDDDRGVVGVAPGARLWAIKVLDSGGSGFTSCVISGFDWATARKREFDDGPADGDPGINIQVLNASLGGSTSTALCSAVSNAVARGIIVVTAAGNNGADASGSGPGNCSMGVTTSAYADFDGMPGGLTPGSFTFANCTESVDDSFACFSNHGSPVDLAAPGVQILSTVPDGLYGWAGGTSMAAPHVAGALVQFRLLGGYSGPADGPLVTSALVASGWVRSQGSTCGFTGDSDTFHEPLVYLGGNCFGDKDGDGRLDQADNCPDRNNPAQDLPSWPVPPGDTDCDGFTTTIEARTYSLASQRCASTVTPDDEVYSSWPTDIDNNRVTNLSDVIRMSPAYNTTEGSLNYDPRFDLNADGTVVLTDILKFGPFFNKPCN
jgi:subtilisin family serine protease